MSSRSQDNNNGNVTRTLKVAEANSRDVGRRIGRVDPKVASEMGLSTGDAIEISAGKKKKLLSSIGLLIKRIMGEGLFVLMDIQEINLKLASTILLILERSKQRRLNKLHLHPLSPYVYWVLKNTLQDF
jgi:hypothetical protein